MLIHPPEVITSHPNIIHPNGNIFVFGRIMRFLLAGKVVLEGWMVCGLGCVGCNCEAESFRELHPGWKPGRADVAVGP